MFWGLRECRSINLQPIREADVSIECAGARITRTIKDVHKHPKFTSSNDDPNRYKLLVVRIVIAVVPLWCFCFPWESSWWEKILALHEYSMRAESSLWYEICDWQSSRHWSTQISSFDIERWRCHEEYFRRLLSSPSICCRRVRRFVSLLQLTSPLRSSL